MNNTEKKGHKERFSLKMKLDQRVCFHTVNTTSINSYHTH